MSKFKFTDPTNGRVYEVNAPEGVSESQAQAIFKQQLDGGSLAGVEVGSVLSAATQAANGLASAQAMLNQTLSAAAGKLPLNSALNTISASLGPGGIAGATQLASSLQGQSASLATNALGSFVGTSLPASSVISAGTALTGAAADAGSFANKSVVNLAGSLQGTVTDGINTADLVKQGSLPRLPDLSATNVQAATSQAAKLVGQPYTVVSDDTGVGKFGFDVQQLETAGFVKAGTSALGTTADASLTSVLSSPTVFTGKSGVTSLDDILANETLQNKIQTDLMSLGLNDLKAVGVPVDSLSAQTVAGLANNSAISVDNTLACLQGTAPPDIKSEFDTLARDSAFAVSFVDTKVDPSVLGEVAVKSAINTVNAETLNAAAKRVVGNPKVPTV